MLEKQGWQLIMKPSLLCARVLRGEYFPNGDFLSATKKKRLGDMEINSLWLRCAKPGFDQADWTGGG